MTTPNIPDLPHTLAYSTGGSNSPLKVGGVDLGSVRIDGTTGNWYDPADLIRELSRFVPIPAEARKVIIDWLAPGEPAEEDEDVPEWERELLERQAEAEPDPVAWVDPWGNMWAKRDNLDEYRRWGRTDEAIHPRAEIEEDYGPLKPLYAHPPVTAEPATAPSVEQIRSAFAIHEVNVDSDDIAICLGVNCRWRCEEDVDGDEYARAIDTHLAEVIRALWSPAPGDATEVHSLAWWRQQCNGQESRAIEADERAAKAEREVIEWQQSRDRAEIARSNAEAENERLRAALEAADQHIGALNLRAKHVDDASRAEHNRAFAVEYAESTGADYDAARAAVEADTTEGA